MHGYITYEYKKTDRIYTEKLYVQNINFSNKFIYTLFLEHTIVQLRSTYRHTTKQSNLCTLKILWSSICHEFIGRIDEKESKVGSRFIVALDIPIERMSNRLRQNPNDSQPRPNPDRMNIHRYRVSYLWSSFITNSVGSSTAISHTLRTESVIPGVYRESGRWSALGGEFHRLVCACFVRTIRRENSEGWERKRRVGDRVIERERERETRANEGVREGHHVLYRVRQSFSSTRTRRKSLCATVQRNYTVLYRCEKLDALASVYRFYRWKSQRI